MAQGGGPPMITDDPGTTPKGTWEINTTFNSAVTNMNEYEIPRLDFNYGANERIQLKIEIPFLLTTTPDKGLARSTGSPVPGIKYRFLDESKHFISVSTYPQAAVAIHADDETQYKLPLQFQKTFKRFAIGEDFGIILSKSTTGNWANGNLLGYIISDKLEVMGEWCTQGNFNRGSAFRSFVNVGMRYEIKRRLMFMTSFGTQTHTPESEQREYFFSYTGLQWRL